MEPEVDLQKLADRGWQQMRQTLDREMPEKSRRRASLAIWLLPAAILLAGGGYFFFQKLGKNAVAQPAQQLPNDQPVATNQPNELASTADFSKIFTEKTTNGSPNRTTASSRVAENSEPDLGQNKVQISSQNLSEKQAVESTAALRSGADLSTPTTGSVQAPTAAKSNFSQKNTPKKNSDALVLAQPRPQNSHVDNRIITDQKSQNAGKAVVETNPLSQNQNSQVVENLKVEKFRTAAEVNSGSAAQPQIPVQNASPDWLTATLPKRAISIISENEELPPSPEKQAIKPLARRVKQPSQWSFGLTAGGIAGDLRRPNGAIVGATVDWHFFNRWALRSGLNYQFLTYRLSDGHVIATHVNAAVYKDLTGQDAFGNGSSTPNDQSKLHTVIIPVNQLSRVELPLLVQFFPHRKWHVSAGASVGRRVNAGTNHQITGQSKNTAAPDAEAQLDEHVRVNLPIWSRFWMAGTGFQFSKNLEINVLLRQNLKKGHAATWESNDPTLPDSELEYHTPGASESFNLNRVEYKKLRPELQLSLLWKF